MKIVEWIKPDAQTARLGRHHWSVPRLFELSRGLPVMDVVIDHMSTYFIYEKLTLREMIGHMKAVEAADLSFPIKAVRFEENPSPCRVDE